MKVSLSRVTVTVAITVGGRVSVTGSSRKGPTAGGVGKRAESGDEQPSRGAGRRAGAGSSGASEPSGSPGARRRAGSVAAATARGWRSRRSATAAAGVGRPPPRRSGRSSLSSATRVEGSTVSAWSTSRAHDSPLQPSEPSGQVGGSSDPSATAASSARVEGRGRRRARERSSRAATRSAYAASVRLRCSTFTLLPGRRSHGRCGPARASPPPACSRLRRAVKPLRGAVSGLHAPIGSNMV